MLFARWFMHRRNGNAVPDSRRHVPGRWHRVRWRRLCSPRSMLHSAFGMCEVATIQVCFGDLGGVIWAPGQNCGTFNCPPLGACCKPDGTCQVAAQSSCEITFGGSYQGDGVECQEARCAPPCPADFDGSGDVGVTDLVSIVEAWGPCAACPEDLDGSGDVGVTDLVALLVAWGDCPSWCGSEARLCTSSRTAADRGRSPCKRLCFDSRRNAGGRRHVRHLP
jgi:hypothetical protein